MSICGFFFFFFLFHENIHLYMYDIEDDLIKQKNRYERMFFFEGINWHYIASFVHFILFDSFRSFFFSSPRVTFRILQHSLSLFFLCLHLTTIIWTSIQMCSIMYSTTWSSVFQLYNKTKWKRTSRQIKELFNQYDLYVCWLIIITPDSIFS